MSRTSASAMRAWLYEKDAPMTAALTTAENFMVSAESIEYQLYGIEWHWC
jgi:hypothetical protein